MSTKNNHVFPARRAGALDNRIRRWIQNPLKILKPYIKEGMTIMDIGCGPGFFTVEMAQLAGRSGRVIAVDLQERMLQRLRDKVKGTEVEKRIRFHKCEVDRIGVSERVDFIFAFYMVHEIPEQKRFLGEIKSLLNRNGRFLIVEPKIHVSKRAFEDTVSKAEEVGLISVERPGIFLSRGVVFEKG